jgi:hypothetical protein
MDLFFNELSLRVANDRFVANSWFQALGNLYKASSAKGLGEIKVAAVFFGHVFTHEYSFYQWANDQNFDHDLRLLLKSRITTTPLIEEMLEEKAAGDEKMFDCQCNGQNAVGLGAASSHLFDAMAISLSTDTLWDKPYVVVNVTGFDGNDIWEDTSDVRHLYQEKHLDEHADWFRTQRRPNLPNGNVLWLQRKSIFPNLIFCENVRGQISGFSGNQPEFLQMKKRLFDLEEYAAKRQAGFFNADELPTLVTPESETRKRDFANELTHICPDGATRLFDWHSRFTPGAGRIHFYPLDDSNKIIVGSIANQNEIK